MAISNRAIKLHLSIDRHMKQTKIYKKNFMNKTKLFSFKKQKLPLFNLNLRNLCSNWHKNKLVLFHPFLAHKNLVTQAHSGDLNVQ